MSVIKKSIKPILYMVMVLSLSLTMTSCGYNGSVQKQEAVNEAWSQVENVYQRRSDLIPNLVKTVEAAGNYEKSTLQAVVEARASATQVKIDPSNLTDENIARYQKAQDGLSSTLSRLLMVNENYPNLKANENYAGLMAELSGTENRIAVERRRFNEVVADYNTHIRTFPNNMTSGMFGFTPKGSSKGTLLF